MNFPLGRIAAPVLGAVVLLAYANALHTSFQFDDYKVIVDNEVVHSWPALAGDLGDGLRPLLKLSYTANWTISPAAFGFHLFNLIVHAANAVLVFLLGRSLGRRYLSTAARADWAALVASMLFALHPANTEAVTYICGRSVSLMSFFYLGGLLGYARALETGDRRWHAVSFVMFLLALATKEVAATYPLALLLWERFGTAPPSWRTSLRRQTPYWIVLLAGAVFALWLTNYSQFLDASLKARDLSSNLLSQIDGLSYLLRQLLCLIPPNIDPDLLPVTAWDAALAARAAALVGLFMAALLNLRARPWLAFGVLWFALHLAPTNSVLPRLDIANDRQLYLSAIGLYWAAAITLFRIELRPRPARWLAAGAAAGLFAALMALTVSRNHDYRDEITLWEATLRQSPSKPRVLNNLGLAYQMAGDAPQAATQFRRALTLRPDYAYAANNLRVLLLLHPELREVRDEAEGGS